MATETPHDHAARLVQANSLKLAWKLYDEARQESNSAKYEQAAIYFEAVGKTDMAEKCLLNADELRR